jgi:predicted nucleotide-binding protein (sugar kinase/HSP70/actin superfamily)
MTIRVGIPRALQIFEYYPFLRTFFGELGVEIVLSPPTNREILTAGSKVVADVTCLPVKVYAGHFIWLRDHGNVNFVYTPAIWSMEKDSFHCAKFKGLPDILKSTVPNCPPLLDIEIDPQNRKLTAEHAFRHMGAKFSWNPLKVQRAWEQACEADRVYRHFTVDAQITYPEALAHLYSQEWPQAAKVSSSSAALTIGLVGHPYYLYDDYINHNLLTRLSDLGVRILTSEMVSPADALAGVQHTTGQVLWFYERWVSGAAGHFLHRPDVDGVIATLAFGCGPDSAMAETITRRSHALQRSCLNLILDEHGSATGMVTRLEAFVDMLLRQKHSVILAATPPVRFHNPGPCQNTAGSFAYG